MICGQLFLDTKGDISPDLDAAEQARKDSKKMVPKTSQKVTTCSMSAFSRKHCIYECCCPQLSHTKSSCSLHKALVYSHHGASILSVLTEPKWFKGTLADLKDVRVRRVRLRRDKLPQPRGGCFARFGRTQAWAAKEGRRRPACLRKDFLIDVPRQNLSCRCETANFSHGTAF